MSPYLPYHARTKPVHRIAMSRELRWLIWLTEKQQWETLNKLFGNVSDPSVAAHRIRQVLYLPHAPLSTKTLILTALNDFHFQQALTNPNPEIWLSVLKTPDNVRRLTTEQRLGCVLSQNYHIRKLVASNPDFRRTERLQALTSPETDHTITSLSERTPSTVNHEPRPEHVLRSLGDLTTAEQQMLRESPFLEIASASWAHTRTPIPAGLLLTQLRQQHRNLIAWHKKPQPDTPLEKLPALLQTISTLTVTAGDGHPVPADVFRSHQYTISAQPRNFR